MTTQPADEDTLIQAARAERRQHRSGASMFAMLGVAVALGVAGCLLIFVPHLVTMLLPGPLRLLGGFSMMSSSPWALLSSGSPGFPAGGACVESAGLVGEQAAGGLPELWPASVALGYGAGRDERQRQGCASWHRHPVRDPRVQLRGCPRHPRERRDVT